MKRSPSMSRTRSMRDSFPSSPWRKERNGRLQAELELAASHQAMEEARVEMDAVRSEMEAARQLAAAAEANPYV